jgi:hypothetical protein
MWSPQILMKRCYQYHYTDEGHQFTWNPVWELTLHPSHSRGREIVNTVESVIVLVEAVGCEEMLWNC